jgi:hypothetical protein
MLMRSLAFAALIAAPQLAQADPIEHAYQTWTSVTLQGDVAKNVILYGDVHARFYDDFRPFQILVRPALGYRFYDRCAAWVGYGWTPSFSPSPDNEFTDEHRIWEQLTWDGPKLPDGMKLFVRSRLEQRFRDGDPVDVGLRFRQMARLITPFVADSPFHLSVWDEVFFSLNEVGAEDKPWQIPGFDQNRLFVGPGAYLTDKVRLEVGYLNHWVNKPTADKVDHAVSINAAVNF